MSGGEEGPRGRSRSGGHRVGARGRREAVVLADEHDRQAEAIERVTSLAEQYLDLDALWGVARQAPSLATQDSGGSPPKTEGPTVARIGVFRDAAFQFYYPENLEALEQVARKDVEAIYEHLDAISSSRFRNALVRGGVYDDLLAEVCR